MKLLTKTTIYFFSAMVVLLVVTASYLYHQFSKQLNERSDQELIADEIQWIDYLATNTDNGTAFVLRTKELSIYPVNSSVSDNPVIEDVREKNLKTNSTIPYRQLSQVVDIGGIPYSITIKKSQEQKAAFIEGFTRIMLFVFAGLFIAAIIFNWLISQSLWAPFKKSLQKIQTAELKQMQAMHFEKTNTTEFNELNTSLNYMTGKIYSDFINMKEFTENAAHEMQTPIAIVQHKLELLLQDNNLTEEQVQSLAEAGEALHRLGKLNQGLLFLAKIENNQYESKAAIGLETVTKKYLQLFHELIKDKELIIETDFKNDFFVQLHPLLADSLVSNLIGNAIKYNYSGGKIIIETTDQSFKICNTSNLPPIDAERLFKRFISLKEQETVSNGLGLAIVKKIADTHNLAIEYKMTGEMHQFSLYTKKPA